jgi:hypothetical protein
MTQQRQYLPFLLSALLCSSISLALVATHEQFRHPFLLPVTACGILIGIDAMRWFLRDIDVFDPAGVLGLLGLHFFYVAPLLHVHWNYWLSEHMWTATIPPPRDWRPWLQELAILNAIGLAIYVPMSRIGRPRPRRRIWVPTPRRMLPTLAAAMGVTLLAQIIVYLQVGIEGTTDLASLGGMGWIFMISESFPILAVMLYGLLAQRNPILRQWSALIVMLLVFFLLRLLFGGLLRGSRSTMVWGLFWAAGVIHLWIRPLPRTLILVALPLLFVFMYVYGFYKSGERDVLRAFDSAEARADLEGRTGRTVEMLLLQDLGRTDVQTFIMYVQSQRISRVEPARGRTYLGALALFVPRSIWPDRPPTKVKEGTALYFGPSADYIDKPVQKVYGMTGEAVLNFGPLAVPVAFLVLGVLVRGVRRLAITQPAADSRLLLIPVLINLSFVVLAGDSDNIVVFAISTGAVPAIVVWLGSEIRRRDAC